MNSPTGNLDPASAEMVATLLLDLHRRQRSILIVVTHSAAIAALFAIRFELAGGTLTRMSGASDDPPSGRPAGPEAPARR